MEENEGKWRFTSPTHVLLAFRQALQELGDEGGIASRCQRYAKCQTRLVVGMGELGFRTLLEAEDHSPIITAFFFPEEPWFEFNAFYDLLKQRRFVIYPGRVSQHETFRIGTIGDLTVDDVDDLLVAINESVIALKKYTTT